MSDSAPTAQCHECGEDIALTKAGLMRKHQAGEDTCPGSGVEPTPAGPVTDTESDEASEGTPPASQEQDEQEGGPSAPTDEDEDLFEDEDDEDVGGPAMPETSEDPRATSTGWQPLGQQPPQQETAPEAAQRGVYSGTVTVKAPCPYLNDDAWHHANAQVIVSRATKAGRTPVGQPSHVGTRHNPAARSYTLTYQVRVL